MTMKVSGEEARSFDAIRLDTFQSVNGKGDLVEADDVTGTVTYKDTPDSQKTITFGMGAIKIMPKGRGR